MKKILVMIMLCTICCVGCGKKEINTIKYFVSFNSMGGTSVKEQIVEEGQSATMPIEPTKKGFTFAGWYLNSELYNFTDAVNRDITLTAHWKENEKSCEKTCPQGYKLDDCTCVKVKTVKRTVRERKSYLYLGESNITIVLDGQTNIETFSSSAVTWISLDDSIAIVDSGTIKAVNEGYTSIIASNSEGDKAVINVRVISTNRENLEAIISLIRPKIIREENTSILYSFRGCDVINTANIADFDGIEIDNGKVISLQSDVNGTLLSAYKVTCGDESENISVEHIVNNSIN